MYPLFLFTVDRSLTVSVVLRLASKVTSLFAVKSALVYRDTFAAFNKDTTLRQAQGAGDDNGLSFSTTKVAASTSGSWPF